MRQIDECEAGKYMNLVDEPFFFRK
jgi:hypothetical protein